MDIRSRSHRVFDYFLVSGLPEGGLPEKTSRYGANTTDKFFFKPSLIWRFPNDRKENPWNSTVQEFLLQLCHPKDILVTYKRSDDSKTFHSFVSTKSDGFRFYGHVLTYFDVIKGDIVKSDTKETVNHDGTEEKITAYAQKCICLISCSAFINTAEKVLRSLYELFSSNQKNLKCSNLPLDSYVYNLLYEMPLPSIGQSLALKWNDVDPIIIGLPSNDELPFLDIHLSTVFDLLGGPANVLRLLTSAFLEHQILIVSEDCHKLILVAEAITALMFPFKWSHTYVPVLPFKLASRFLDAPVPFIMGIPLGSCDEKLTHISSEFGQCFVNIDDGIVECPEDQPLFPDRFTLVNQLSDIYKKFQGRLDPLAMESVIEETSVIAEEESQSPSMQRRNATKSKKLGEDAISQKQKDHTVAEDLRNLHANIPYTSDSHDLKSLKSSKEDIQQKLFNLRVRETIFGTLVSVLSQYEKFVILPELAEHESVEMWLSTRDSQNFDKSSFLSDQRGSHLVFLSPFLETQAFAYLVDRYILSQLNKTYKDHSLLLLSNRIKQAKGMPHPDKAQDPMLHSALNSRSANQLSDLYRSLSTISAGRSAKLSVETWIKSSESALKKRHLFVNGRYPQINPLSDSNKESEDDRKRHGTFPCFTNLSLLLESVEDFEEETVESPTLQIPEPQSGIIRQTSVSEMTADMIAQTNWNFLEKLLKDVKAKTNKLVVCKLGQEAHALGHADATIMGLEENTLLGSLCDLLERIWCHGLNANQKVGKSALWSHLLRYEEDEKRMRMRALPKMTHGGRSSIVELEENLAIPASHETVAHAGNPDDLQNKVEGFIIPPVVCDLITNINRIQQLNEVKTNVGKCRAWIRLALEQKQLQDHLKKLLMNRPLLQTTYKRYSLLRCDDAREQFLYHLLSLNAVDFTSFSNSFTRTAIRYRVWIFPKKQLSGTSYTTANVHIMISGELACTDRISVPKNCNEFTFHHQNLGVVTTMLLSHDNSGILPRWLVDHVIVRNELTGQGYYLPCGRWLGHGVDDNSTQRLLIAYQIPFQKDLNTFLREINSGKVPSSFQTITTKDVNVDLLQDYIGQCVNELVQHLNKNSRGVSMIGALTPLLLRPNGLVSVLSLIFNHGLKSSRLPFRKRQFAWDVISATCDKLSGKSDMVEDSNSYTTALINIMYNTPSSSPRRSLTSGTPVSASPRNSLTGGILASLSPRTSLTGTTPTPAVKTYRSNARYEGDLVLGQEDHQSDNAEMTFAIDQLLYLFDLISNKAVKGLGKDDMFQLFVCVGLKNHLISDWLALISSNLIRNSSFYEKNAFMTDTNAVCNICSILNNLKDYPMNFEQILWRGVNLS